MKQIEKEKFRNCLDQKINMGSPNTSSLSLLILLIFTSILPLIICYSNKEKNNIKGIFVFGSSLVDNGDNIFLDTIAKPDYLPYGIDFPQGTTGRFTNGKNVIDIFSEYLKIPHFIPPFYNPSTNGTKIINGVDFASGGSGILELTGTRVGKVPNLSTQIRNFEEKTLPELEVQLHMNSKKLLRNYMFVVGIGGNDYTNNYFFNPINQTVEAFTTNLIRLLSDQIKVLHRLGGRKFVIMSAYPLGCYPYIRDAQKICNETLNDAAKIYNSQLKSMVDDLHSKMPGSHLVLVEAYNIMQNLINHPASRGFKNVTNSCCEVVMSLTGKKGNACLKNGKVCEDRKRYIFFDGLHPTEATNYIIASKAFNSNHKSEVYPFNITKLSII